MSTHGSCPRRRQIAVRLGLCVLLVATLALSSGCGLLSQQTEAPHPSTTIHSFMQQPRPGEGIIGP